MNKYDKKNRRLKIECSKKLKRNLHYVIYPRWFRRRGASSRYLLLFIIIIISFILSQSSNSNSGIKLTTQSPRIGLRQRAEKARFRHSITKRHTLKKTTTSITTTSKPSSTTTVYVPTPSTKAFSVYTRYLYSHSKYSPNFNY